jgi:hypothetical protein
MASLISRRLFLGGAATSWASASAAADSIRSVVDFGAICDGRTESSLALQRGLDWASSSGHPLGVPGPILIRNSVYYGSNLDLRGIVPGAAILAIGLPGHASLLSPSGLMPMHQNVSISDLSFIGEGPRNPRYSAMLRFARTSGVKISRCTLSDYRFIMLGIFGCSEVSISQSQFSNFGSVSSDRPGGPAIHLAADAQGTPSTDVVIAGNSFHDGHWVALSIYAKRVTISNNAISNVAESGIFAFRDRPGDNEQSGASQLHIRQNRIENVVRRDVSATGIEIGADGALVEGNKIYNTGSSGIMVLSPASNTEVRTNLVTNSVRQVDYFREHGQIQITAGVGTPDWPSNIRILRNDVTDTSVPRVAPYGIAVRAPVGQVRQIPGLEISGNRLAGGWAHRPIYVENGILDAHAVVQTE